MNAETFLDIAIFFTGALFGYIVAQIQNLRAEARRERKRLTDER